MTKDLGNLRMYQIMKDDSTYNNAFNKRIAKLENYKSKMDAGKLKKEVGKSILLTKECHQTAEVLKKTYIRLVETFPAGSEKALDQLIAFQSKATNKSKYSKMEFPKEMLEVARAKHRKENEIAKQVLLEAISSSKGDKDKTMPEFVNSKYPETDNFENVSLRMSIAILMTNYQVYMSSIGACVEFIKLAQMFRGLFYMGIVEIHGGELDKKIFNDHMKDFVSEALGVFAPPLVSNAISLVKMIKISIDTVNDLQGVELPDVVKETQEVMLFFQKYQKSLKVWKSTATSQITLLENLRNALRQYQ